MALHGGGQLGLRLAKARQQKAFHTGPSYGAVSRKISCLVWIIIGRQTAKAVCVLGVRAGCVLCGRGHRQKPGDGCAMSHQEISIVRQKKDSSVGGRVRAVREGAVRAVRCCEASVKARYLHGVSARHRSWYESGSSSASKGGRAGGGGAGRGCWAGPTFRDARRCRLRMHARGTTPCRCRALTCSGRSWVDTRA